jgi:predicted transport protein
VESPTGIAYEDSYGSRGSEDLEVTIRNDEDIERAKALIVQSYESA